MNREITKQCVKELEPIVKKLQQRKTQKAEKEYEKLVEKFPPILEDDLNEDVVIFIWAINEYLGELSSYDLQDISFLFDELSKKWLSSQE